MLWFLMVLTAAAFWGVYKSDIVEFIAVFLIGTMLALVLNVAIGAIWFGQNWKRYAVDGPVQTKVVNGESSFVFRAGGQDWVLSTNDTTVNVGTPELAVSHRSHPAPLWTVLDIGLDSPSYALTIRPS